MLLDACISGVDDDLKDEVMIMQLVLVEHVLNSLLRIAPGRLHGVGEFDVEKFSRLLRCHLVHLLELRPIM